MPDFPFRGQGAASSWKEVTIPAGEINTLGRIGRGRFGEVHEAYHFGPVALKILDMLHVEEDKRMEVFKEDVACYQVGVTLKVLSFAHKPRRI